MPNVYLMIGNPGVGKSTLLNGLLGQPQFKSGISVGAGMTYKMDSYTSPKGNVYADTPGLADTEKRQQAAQAITEALKLGGRFRIFFVVTLQQGRVSPEDKATMKLVLDAAPITSYGIIINQLSPKEYEVLIGEDAGADHRTASPGEQVLKQLLVGLPADQQTPHVHLMMRDKELDGIDDAAKPLPQDLKNFIEASCPVVIEPSTVDQVRADEFEKEREAFAEKLHDMNNDNESLQEALKLTRAEVADLKTKAEKQRQAMDDVEEKAENDFKAMEDLKTRNNKLKRRIDQDSNNERKMRKTSGGFLGVLFTAVLGAVATVATGGAAAPMAAAALGNAAAALGTAAVAASK